MNTTIKQVQQRTKSANLIIYLAFRINSFTIQSYQLLSHQVLPTGQLRQASLRPQSLQCDSFVLSVIGPISTSIVPDVTDEAIGSDKCRGFIIVGDVGPVITVGNSIGT